MNSRQRASLLLAAVCLLGACRSQPHSGEEVWAQVNGQPIYRGQVEKLVAQRTRNVPEPFSPAEAQAFKLRVLGELIENEILWQKASQAGLLAGDNEVEARFQELRSSFSNEEFSRQLGDQQLTPDELKSLLRREIAIQKLLDQYLGRRVEVSGSEVAEYFQQHRSEFRFVETHYRVAYILVGPGQDPEVRNLRNDDAVGDTAAKRKAEMIVGRLRAGDDFGELARSFSEDPTTALQGGEMGFFPESALINTPAPLRAAVMAMEAGQLVGPIRTEKGYYVVKLLERQPAGQREISDPNVQQAVAERLRRQKRQLLEAAFAERARNQAHVVNHLARQILEANRVAP